MKTFCNICKQTIACEYCVKYGINGIYIYLEKKLINNKKKYNYISNIPNYDTNLLNASQYKSLSRFNKG